MRACAYCNKLRRSFTRWPALPAVLHSPTSKTALENAGAKQHCWGKLINQQNNINPEQVCTEKGKEINSINLRQVGKENVLEKKQIFTRSGRKVKKPKKFESNFDLFPQIKGGRMLGLK